MWHQLPDAATVAMLEPHLSVVEDDHYDFVQFKENAPHQGAHKVKGHDTRQRAIRPEFRFNTRWAALCLARITLR